jgi:hypothetical protein
MVEPLGGVMVLSTKGDLPRCNDRFRNTNESRIDGSGGVRRKPCSTVREKAASVSKDKKKSLTCALQ